MEAAEEEMDNTFKRTTELHRSTAERREQEILELRKVRKLTNSLIFKKGKRSNSVVTYIVHYVRFLNV
jgi:hypothetical protein